MDESSCFVSDTDSNSTWESEKLKDVIQHQVHNATSRLSEMEFIKIAKGFQFAAVRKLRNNDFFVDRLSHRITNNIILGCILLATFRRFFSNPIDCWVPAELTRYAEYMQRYCWLKGTYYVDQNYDHHMLSITAREESILQYYQWVYLFLCIQAFMFYMPRLMWIFITDRLFDFDLFNLIEAAKKYEVYGTDKNKILKFLKAGVTQNHSCYLSVKQQQLLSKVERKIDQISIDENEELINAPEAQQDAPIREEDTLIGSAKFKFSTSLITFTYMGIKFLYLSVAVFQILLMNAYLSTKTNEYYGSEVFQRVMSGTNEINDTDSKIFPRITICDVKTKELGTTHTYTIQCVLSFNLFNERIYAFLWFWIFCILIPFTIIDMVAWCYKFFVRGASYRYNWIYDRLIIYEEVKIKTSRQKNLLRIFTEYYVGTDGVFTLLLLEHNSNASIVSELLRDMWTHFLLEQKH